MDMNSIKQQAFVDELQKIAAMPQFKGVLSKMLGRAGSAATHAPATTVAGTAVSAAAKPASNLIHGVDPAAVRSSAMRAFSMGK